VRLDDAITCFLQQWPAEGPSSETVETYSSHLKFLATYAARQHCLRLAELTPDVLRGAMRAKMAAVAAGRPTNWKGGEAAAKGLRAATRKLVGWLLAQGVPVADVSSVKAPRVPERIQPRLHADEFFAIEQAILRRLLRPDRRIPRVAIGRDLALINLLADTGLRADEVCALELRSIDFAQSAIMVRRGKGKKERALSLLNPDEPGGGRTSPKSPDSLTLAFISTDHIVSTRYTRGVCAARSRFGFTSFRRERAAHYGAQLLAVGYVSAMFARRRLVPSARGRRSGLRERTARRAGA